MKKKTYEQSKEKLKDWYDPIANKYDSRGIQEGEFQTSSRAKELKAFKTLLDQVSLRKNSQVLDIVTGTGIYLIESLKRGSKGYGIDVSKKMIEVFSKKIKNTDFEIRITLKIGDADKIPFKQKFNLITCISLFDYFDLDHVRKFLEEMKTITRKLE